MWPWRRRSFGELPNALERRMVNFTGGLKFMAWWLGANGYGRAAFIVMLMKGKVLIPRRLRRVAEIVARFRLLCSPVTVAWEATTPHIQK